MTVDTFHAKAILKKKERFGYPLNPDTVLAGAKARSWIWNRGASTQMVVAPNNPSLALI